jgi:hypothetical protein
MNEIFTVEEINLICVFDTSDRGKLKNELSSAAANFDTGNAESDAEMREIAANALAKLGGMSDADFAALELYPEYSDEDFYETEV